MGINSMLYKVKKEGLYALLKFWLQKILCEPCFIEFEHFMQSYLTYKG